MHRYDHAALRQLATRLALVVIATVSAALPAAAADGRKVVIPFDFVSKFDNGRYGQMVGEMIWKKLSRESALLVPDSMLDVRDTCRANGVVPRPDMPLADLGKIVRQEFDADIGVVGSIERRPNVQWDEYDFTLKCVDFTAAAEPKVVYEVAAQTKTVSEIPHLYVKAMLDALSGRTSAEEGPPPVDEMAEDFWKKNPNLVAGDFQSGAGGVPMGWEAVGGQQREALGKLVQWTAEKAGGANRLIRFVIDKATGDSTGVMYYSQPFAIEAGATYRIEFRWRSDGPTPLVFVKCYDNVAGPYRAEGDRSSAAPAARSAKESTEKPSAAKSTAKTKPAPQAAASDRYAGQLREVYRCQCNPKGEGDGWHTHTQDFTPKHTRFVPREGRVMLYAFKGAGTVEWDDVVVKQIMPASPGANTAPARHSLETKVTLEQMRENERRSRAAPNDDETAPPRTAQPAPAP